MSVETITDEGNVEYEEILQQIDDEYEKQESIKTELKILNTKINANHLVIKNNNDKMHLFYATVKIFDNLIDLIEFYGHDIRKEIDNLLEKDKDFYVIDLKISQLLQNHILTKKWLFNINVLNNKSGLAVNKSINIKNNASNRILSVTSIDKNINKTTVNISLIWPDRNYWPILKLQPIEIDISYHFRSKIDEHLSNINTSFQPQHKSKQHSLKIITNFTKRTLLEALLEHSHHRFDISQFLDGDVIIKMQFLVDDSSLIKLQFDEDSRELTLEANSYVLKLLKEFFYTKQIFRTDKPLDGYKRDLETGVLDFNQLIYIYNHLRV